MPPKRPQGNSRPAAASRGIIVRPLAESEIPSVVSLHRSAMSYSFNSRLGIAHLSYVYSIMAKDPNSLVVAAHRNGILAGAASATLDPERLKAELLRRQTFRQRGRLGLTLIRQPRLLLDFFTNSRLEGPVLHRGVPVEAFLATIFVSPEIRGRGVGRALASAVDSFFRQHDRSAYWLDTRADNAQAAAFYRRLGFQELGQRGPNILFLRDLSQESG